MLAEVEINMNTGNIFINSVNKGSISGSIMGFVTHCAFNQIKLKQP